MRSQRLQVELRPPWTQIFISKILHVVAVVGQVVLVDVVVALLGKIEVEVGEEVGGIGGALMKTGEREEEEEDGSLKVDEGNLMVDVEEALGVDEVGATGGIVLPMLKMRVIFHPLEPVNCN